MDKLAEFKSFAFKNPYLQEKVKNKETTWQELYETYEIYGENHEIFQKKVAETNSTTSTATDDTKKDFNLNNVLNTLQSIDLVKVSEGLTSLKKIVDIFSELTPKNNAQNQDSNNSRRSFRRYND